MIVDAARSEIVRRVRDFPFPNEQRLMKAVASSRTVSFDIFDTIIKRDVGSVENLFRLVQIVYEREHGPLGFDFLTLRREAERIARSRKLNHEVYLTDIYQVFGDVARASTAVVERLQELEVGLDREVSTGNDRILKLLKWCLARKKRVFLVSDTYYNLDQIRCLLAPILELDDIEVVLSCEHGASKRSGALFNVILGRDLGRDKNIVHIGDSPIEDWLRPALKGIRVVRIPTTWNAIKFRPSSGLDEFDEGLIQAMLRNHPVPEGRSQYWQFGYEILGPLLAGFCLWLSERAEEDGVDRLLFCSRDGHLLLKAYESLNLESRISSRYFYTSRRAINGALLWSTERRKVLKELTGDEKFLSLRQMLETLGLEKSDWSEVVKDSGLDIDRVVDRRTLCHAEPFQQVIRHLWPIVVSRSKERFCYLLEYLRDLECEGDVGLVDLGWKGTIQDRLVEARQLVGSRSRCIGYYVGLRGTSTATSVKRGFLFDAIRRGREGRRQSSYIGLTELLFFAAEGSATAYASREEGWVCKADYEYVGDRQYEERVSDVQAGALAFVSRCPLSVAYALSLDGAACFTGLMRVGEQPSSAVLAMFKRFPFYDSTKRTLVETPSFSTFVHPKLMLRMFTASRWKAGLLTETLRSRRLVALCLRVLYK